MARSTKEKAPKGVVEVAPMQQFHDFVERHRGEATGRAERLLPHFDAHKEAMITGKHEPAFCKDCDHLLTIQHEIEDAQRLESRRLWEERNPHAHAREQRALAYERACMQAMENGQPAPEPPAEPMEATPLPPAEELTPEALEDAPHEAFFEPDPA